MFSLTNPNALFARCSLTLESSPSRVRGQHDTSSFPHKFLVILFFMKQVHPLPTCTPSTSTQLADALAIKVPSPTPRNPLPQMSPLRFLTFLGMRHPHNLSTDLSQWDSGNYYGPRLASSQFKKRRKKILHPSVSLTIGSTVPATVELYHTVLS